MKKLRVLLATLCDKRITIDDCVHRVTYKFYLTPNGLEACYRHTMRYCPPWATPEERKPQVEKKTILCSESLCGMLDKLRRGSFPANPCPPIDAELYPDMSLKFGNESSAVSFCWCCGNPPNEWKELDAFALAAMSEVYDKIRE